MSAAWRVTVRGREAGVIVERLRAGVSTVIVGEAGIGKTALAREVAERLRVDGGSPLFVTGGDWVAADLPQTLVDMADTAAAVVVIDDAHLFEPSSAQALGRLLTATRTRIVATVRTGDKPLHPIGWLWAIGACERLPLGPLDTDEVRLLAEQQLGGEVDDALADLLRERTRGNALLVGHLLRAAVQSGALTRARGAWRPAGDLPVTMAAADTVRADLADLGGQAAQVLQMVALAEPLRLRVAERIAASADLESLESRHLIAVDTHADEPTISCAHPLYGEVLRADLGLLRSRRLRATLLRTIGRETPIPDRERLLSASWRMDLGETIAVEELMACARLAATTRPALAEQLLRRALAVDPGGPFAVEAAAMLGHLLLIEGRIAEADQIVAHAMTQAPASGTGEMRENLAGVRALIRIRLGEIAQALQMVGAAPESVDGVGEDRRVDLQAQALYAQVMLLSARLDETLRITQPLMTEPGMTEPGMAGFGTDGSGEAVARATAAYVEVAAHSFAGRIADTSAALRRGIPLLAATREQLPYGMAMAQVSTAIGQVFAGHLPAAARLGQRMHEIADHDDDPWQRPRGATVLGLVALYRGLADTAVEHLRTAVGALTPLDAMFARYNRAFLARAAALAGNLREAQQALQLAADAPEFPLYEADWQIAESAVLAGQFRAGEAARHAMAAARTAAGHGQWAIAAIAAHDAARYADLAESVALLATAADLTDGPLPPLLLEHATARSCHDPDRLHAVSVEFERLGATLFAAEAAYAAARAHRDCAATNRQVARAIELHGRCERAFLPWVLGRAATGLTARERHVALLAAGGHSDQRIGDELAISIRTVQTHLTHVYTKLDVSGRGALAAALTTERR